MREKINAFFKMLVCLSAALYPVFVRLKDRIFCFSLQSRLNHSFSSLFYFFIVAMETALTATATVAGAVSVLFS